MYLGDWLFFANMNNVVLSAVVLSTNDSYKSWSTFQFPVFIWLSDQLVSLCIWVTKYISENGKVRRNQ